MAEDGQTLAKDGKEEEDPQPRQDIESQINTAMRARDAYFKELSDSLTFEGVRRLLEKDLGLETFALDVHKRFIKQLLHQLLECANDGNDSKSNEESEGKRDNVETGGKGEAREEEAESPGGHQQSSPVLGLLTGQKITKRETEESKGVKKKTLNKGTIKAAIRKRAQYLKDKSEQLTLAGLRRLLEKDLQLEIYSLDPYKKFINDQVDEVLNSPEVSQPAMSAKKNSKKKVAKKVRNEESSDSSERKSDEDEDEDEVKPKKKFVSKGKGTNESKKRKKPTKDTNISGKKRIEAAETLTEKSSEADDNGNVSEDGDSQSSAENSMKKKVVSTPVYGKRVEHLKTVIKACGMSVPPSVYKKVKQAPENKRESHLIKELEEILSKEGLSLNPTEKGLNKNLDEVRGRILAAKPLPQIWEAFSEVRREESRKKVMMKETSTPAVMEGLALISRGQGHQNFETRGKKGRRWCDHCHKPGHTRDNCWKIHGRLANIKTNGTRDQSAKSDKEGRSFVATGEEPLAKTLFSKEQISLLQKMFGQVSTSQSVMGTRAVAQKGFGFGEDD